VLGRVRKSRRAPEGATEFPPLHSVRNFSSAPAGACWVETSFPRAHALGYILSRLRRCAGGEKCALMVRARSQLSYIISHIPPRNLQRIFSLAAFRRSHETGKLFPRWLQLPHPGSSRQLQRSKTAQEKSCRKSKDKSLSQADVHWRILPGQCPSVQSGGIPSPPVESNAGISAE